MNLLGSLGVNVKLLVAQIVNFGLLLWILTKFVYKPIIQRIEKDEAELKQAETLKKELEQQKSKFENLKMSESAEIKKRTKEILQEAESISNESKKQAQIAVERETAAMIEQTKTALLVERPSLKQELIKEINNEIKVNFKKSFNNNLSAESQKEIQNILFKDLLRKINLAPLPSSIGVSTANILKKVKLLDKGKMLEGRIEGLLNQKIGPVVLESSFPLSEGEKVELLAAIAKKIGFKKTSERSQIDTAIQYKLNEDLIDGFRLELAGLLIESNFLDLAKHATNFKE